MGNPDCDRCGQEITQDETLIQVTAHVPYRHELDEGGLTHVAYYHADCWRLIQTPASGPGETGGV